MPRIIEEGSIVVFVSFVAGRSVASFPECEPCAPVNTGSIAGVASLGGNPPLLRCSYPSETSVRGYRGCFSWVLCGCVSSLEGRMVFWRWRVAGLVTIGGRASFLRIQGRTSSSSDDSG